MAATVDRRAPPVLSTAGSSVRSSSSGSPVRGASATLNADHFRAVAPGGRARPSTQDVITEAFGRRLHDLSLVSVKALNQLTASAAKLEAQVASRTAAISRTAASTTGDSGLGGHTTAGGLLGPATGSKRALGASFGPGPEPGDASSSPKAGYSFAPGLAATGATQADSPPSPTSPATKPELGAGIMGRGSAVVRLLALQDKVLHGAILAQQQSTAASGATTAGGALASGGSGAPGGSRFASLGPLGGAGLEGVSPDERERLDSLGIRHGSRVASAAVQLFRLTPRKLDSREDGSPTPPNTGRGETFEAGDDGRSVSARARAKLQSTVRQHMLAKREYHLMNKFIKHLEEADELSLINRARSFTKQESSRNSSANSSRRNLSRNVSTSLDAKYGSFAAARPVVPPGQSAVARLPTFTAHHASGVAAAAAQRMHPSAAAAAAGAAAEAARASSSGQGSRPGSVGGSPEGSRRPTPRGGNAGAQEPIPEGSGEGEGEGEAAVEGVEAQAPPGPPKEPAMDLSVMSTGQRRAMDLLDGLAHAVSVDASPSPSRSGQAPLDGASRPGSRLSPQRPASRQVVPSLSFAHQFGFEGVQTVPHSPTTLPALYDGESRAAFSGTYGSPERMAERLRMGLDLAVKSNPAGFREEAAAAEVALYRQVAGRGRTALRRTLEQPRDAHAAADLARQVTLLHICRPYFLPPAKPPPDVALPRRAPGKGLARQPTLTPEHEAPLDSVFLPRVSDNDSGDMVDTHAVRERQVRKDWNRVVRKDNFRSMFARDDPGVAAGTAGLGASLDAVLAVLLRHKDSLRSSFTYYGMQGTNVSDACFTVGHNEWRAFVGDCGLIAGQGGQAGAGGGSRLGTPSTSPSRLGTPAAGAARVPPLNLPGARPGTSPGVQAPDRGAGVGAGAAGPGREASQSSPASPRGASRGVIPLLQQADTVFAAVNWEADKRSAEAEVNADRALMRFEWYEALIRMAVIRHVKGGAHLGSIADALEHMWSCEVLPRLPPEALVEPNAWRRARLYADAGTNEVLADNMGTLTAVYNLYRASNKNKLLHLEDWVGLLSTHGMLGEATGLSARDAKLAFARSLCVVVDELGRWGRATGADRCDFLEGLCRLAEALEPPDREEVAAALHQHLGLNMGQLEVAMTHPWLCYYTLIPPVTLMARRRAAQEAAAERRAAAEAAAAAAAEAARSAEGGAATYLSPRPSGAADAPSLPAALAPDLTSSASVQPLLQGVLSGSLVVGSRPGSAASVAARLGSPPAALPPPPPPGPELPPLVDRLEGLLDLLLGRLRERWECEDDGQLAVRLQAAAKSISSDL